MSSAEILSLMNNLSLITGNYIEQDNEHWTLYIILKRIISIVVSSVVHAKTHKILESEIEEFLSLHSKLFPNSMKPKHHFMVHHPRVMEQTGPLWNSCSMRFESKHHEGKVISYSAISRVNVCYTIALRNQLKLHYRFMKGKTSDPMLTLSSTKAGIIENIPSQLNIDGNTVRILKWIKRGKRQIQNDTIIMIPEESGPAFHKVSHMIFEPTGNISILTLKLNSCYYHDHFDAYEISDPNDTKPGFISEGQILNYTTIITSQVPVRNGFSYISKTWM